MTGLPVNVFAVSPRTGIWICGLSCLDPDPAEAAACPSSLLAFASFCRSLAICYSISRALLAGPSSDVTAARFLIAGARSPELKLPTAFSGPVPAIVRARETRADFTALSAPNLMSATTADEARFPLNSVALLGRLSSPGFNDAGCPSLRCRVNHIGGLRGEGKPSRAGAP